jgi:hypothetical protein
LIWFRDSNYVHRVPGLADDFDTRAVQTTIAALEGLQAYLAAQPRK